MRKRLFRFFFPFPFLAFLLFLYACEPSLPKQTYHIGRDSSWELSSFDLMTPAINAYLNEVVQALGGQMRETLSLVEMCGPDLLLALEEKKVDAILAVLPENKENRERFEFSPLLLLTGPVLIVPEHSKIQSLEDIGRTTVGVYAFDDSIYFIQKRPEAIIKMYETIPSLLEAVANGDVEVGAAPAVNAERLAGSRFKNEIKILSPPFLIQASAL